MSNQGDKVIETEEIISEDKAIAEVFNKFFIDIVSNLKISIENDFDTSFSPTEDLVQNAISKYRNHPRVVIIKEKNNLIGKFSFSLVQYDDILKKVRNLDTAKASKQTDITTKILKHNSEYFAEYFYDNINYCIENSNFPSDLKSADVTPYKKVKTSKDNYRPVSILSNERCLYEQLQSYFEKILSPYQCGFLKGFNAQHCLIVLIETWRKSVDSGGPFGALMTDLSKSLDCLSHDLLIAKLDAYGFDKKSLKLVYSYLSNRKQRVKINTYIQLFG